MWHCEWGGSMINSSGTSNSRGVSILINPRLKAKVSVQKSDHDGHFVMCTINMLEEDVNFTFCNLYAPNSDTPEFFKSAFKTILKHAVENVVIGGDFNSGLCPELD